MSANLSVITLLMSDGSFMRGPGPGRNLPLIRCDNPDLAASEKRAFEVKASQTQLPCNQ